MCHHLLDKGYQLSVYNRTASRADDLLAKGASWKDSPADVARDSDIIFTMVGFPSDVRQVILGEQGVLKSAREHSILVDMTTSEPSLAREIAAAAARQHIQTLDAPVSGGDIGAKNATLSIMVGGHEEAFRRVLPCFEALGKTIRLQGEAGAGQHTKMVNQILIATNMIGVCEAMLYARKAQLDPLRVIESVGSGAAGSWSVNNLAPRMQKRDFEPGFFVEHFLKDLDIALRESRHMGLVMPGLALAEQLYQAVRVQGRGRKGTQALLLALESLSGISER
jgi:3-hydroxyisobutyrate dehydrogenase